jgi:CheY-like chemotaxis protein
MDINFAENLKKVRKEKKLSQYELARKMDIAQSTVGMWETRKRTPKLDEIAKLAGVLDITIDLLIGSKEKTVEIVSNEVFVDGKKVNDLDTCDIEEIVRLISTIKKGKGISSDPIDKKTQSGPKKILIIDDEQEMCELLYTFLAPHNYKVFLTFNGQMGLEYFEEVRPDLVLLDLTMPDIEGIDVLRIIRKVSDVPVIVITAHPEEIAEIHLEDLHIAGYLEKPFSLEHVLNTLKHIIGE